MSETSMVNSSESEIGLEKPLPLYLHSRMHLGLLLVSQLSALTAPFFISKSLAMAPVVFALLGAGWGIEVLATGRGHGWPAADSKMRRQAWILITVCAVSLLLLLYFQGQVIHRLSQEKWWMPSLFPLAMMVVIIFQRWQQIFAYWSTPPTR